MTMTDKQKTFSDASNSQLLDCLHVSTNQVTIHADIVTADTFKWHSDNIDAITNEIEFRKAIGFMN